MKFLVLMLVAATAMAAGAQENLRATLEKTYGVWKQAMETKDARTWQRITASNRQIEVRNRILSEKLPFPAAVFDLPAPPPALAGLRFLDAKQKGPTAKAAYFGRIDFCGSPTDNLLVLSFLAEEGHWRYDRAEFVNLAALPAVRAELARGDLSYLEETPEAQPSGELPPRPVAVPAPKYIAKVYVFCPGREVQVQVNRLSQHRFANAKEAETVLGGARDGLNEVQYTVKPLEGGTGKEAMAIRVYVLSEVPGVMPIKAFEYLVNEGEEIKDFSTTQFTVTPAMAAQLEGR
jgi:hypothetical protein